MHTDNRAPIENPLRDRAKGTFLNLVGQGDHIGKFAQRVPKGTPGSVTRITKEGKEVSEVYRGELEAYIDSIELVEGGNYGSQWHVKLSTGVPGGEMILTFGYNSRHIKTILKVFPNIDLDKSVLFGPSVKVVEGEPEVSLFLSQRDHDGAFKMVPFVYTAKTPNGMPEREMVTLNGNTSYDYTKQLTFLFDIAKDKLSRAKLPNNGETMESIAGSVSDSVPNTGAHIETNTTHDTALKQAEQTPF